jgi:hypothetical protein
MVVGVQAPDSRLAVFCGPSLPLADRVPVDVVMYLPPASRGDVEGASHEYDAVLLIDGVFHHDLAPSPKECYAASQRTRMFGASSMGALRAAECWPFGFVPLGIIARWYIKEVIDGDDEVAVLTHPITHVALGVPMVNVRYVTWLARRRGLIVKSEADALIDAARNVFYMDRTWDDVYQFVPHQARQSFQKLAQSHGDVKRHDARFALRSVLRRLCKESMSHERLETA